PIEQESSHSTFAVEANGSRLCNTSANDSACATVLSRERTTEDVVARRALDCSIGQRARPGVGSRSHREGCACVACARRRYTFVGLCSSIYLLLQRESK